MKYAFVLLVLLIGIIALVEASAIPELEKVLSFHYQLT
jgi:hypothetical protein